MKEVEKELTERGRKLQLEGEDTCTDMITMACEVGKDITKFSFMYVNCLLPSHCRLFLGRCLAVFTCQLNLLFSYLSLEAGMVR